MPGSVVRDELAGGGFGFFVGVELTEEEYFRRAVFLNHAEHDIRMTAILDHLGRQVALLKLGARDARGDETLALVRSELGSFGRHHEPQHQGLKGQPPPVRLLIDTSGREAGRRRALTPYPTGVMAEVGARLPAGVNNGDSGTNGAPHPAKRRQWTGARLASRMWGACSTQPRTRACALPLLTALPTSALAPP